jgi:hypothetical protein
MSAVALRHMMIRLLHDPVLVEQLHRQPSVALDGIDLTPTEHRWLLATPRAAWHTDPDRPQRVLTALEEEFPVSVAAAPPNRLAFFGAPAFHEAVQQRGSLAAAFGAWLVTVVTPHVAVMAEIETTIAQTRRAPRVPPRSPGNDRRLTPAARLLAMPAGTLGRYERARQGGQLPVPAAAPAAREALLVFRPPRERHVTVEQLPTALAELLELARTPHPRAGLVAAARRFGAERGEDEEIVAGLETDGLLL